MRLRLYQSSKSYNLKSLNPTNPIIVFKLYFRLYTSSRGVASELNYA
jgi:hypothetical protein